jgi:tetratricopeptide (TPR) repeat protein
MPRPRPHYASAYAGYASALDAATTYNIGTPEQLMPKAIAAAQRAIQLDPQNVEAYTALGSVQTIYEWDWTAAEQNLTRGISLNPSDSIAEFKYAVYLDAVGRPQDAVAHMRRALQLDPLSSSSTAGWALLFTMTTNSMPHLLNYSAPPRWNNCPAPSKTT